MRDEIVIHMLLNSKKTLPILWYNFKFSKYIDLAKPKSGAPGPVCVKPDEAELKIRGNVDLSSVTLRWGFCWCCFGLLFWVWIISRSSKFKNNCENFCKQEKNYSSVNFYNLGLALTSLRTTRPWLQQASLTWARNPDNNLHLVRDQVRRNTW